MGLRVAQRGLKKKLLIGVSLFALVFSPVFTLAQTVNVFASSPIAGVSATVTNTAQYRSSTIDGRLFTNLTLSFSYDARDLDATPTLDVLHYGWSDGVTDHELGSVAGLSGNDAAEQSAVSVALPSSALINGISVYATVTANTSSDNVEITNLTLNGTDAPLTPQIQNITFPALTVNNPTCTEGGSVTLPAVEHAKWVETTGSQATWAAPKAGPFAVTNIQPGFFSAHLVPDEGYQVIGGNASGGSASTFEVPPAGNCVTPDTTNPNVQYVTPATDGARLSGEATIEVKYADDTELSQTTLHAYMVTGSGATAVYTPVSQIWQHPNVDGAGNTLTAPLEGLADGTYQIRAAATDEAGNSVQQNRLFVVDNTKPTVAIKATGSNSANGAYNKISFNACDKPSATGKLAGFVLNGHTYARSTVCNDLNWQNITKSHLVEGKNTIYSIDAAGNQSDEITFVYDKTGPTIDVKPGSISSDDASVYRKISFKLFDKHKVDKITLNGVEKDLTDDKWSDVNNVRAGMFGAVEGVNVLVAYDTLGNTSTYTFTIDSTLANAPEIITPTNGQYVNGDSATNEWTSEHGAVLYRVKYELTTGVQYREETSTSRTETFVDGYQGPVTISVQAKNALGNWSEYGPSVTYFYDSVSPTVEIPTYGVVGNIIQPHVQVTDASPLTYLWSTNPSVDISDVNAAEPTFTVNVDGTYVFTLTVTDAAGNSTVREFGFTYTTPPVTNPDDGTNTGDGDGNEGEEPVVDPIDSEEVLPDDDDGDAFAPLAAIVTPRFTNVATTTPGVNGNQTPASDDGEGVDEKAAVLSASDKDAAETALKDTAVAGASTQGGVAWYLWAAALVVVAAGWWFIAAARRKAE